MSRASDTFGRYCPNWTAPVWAEGTDPESIQPPDFPQPWLDRLRGDAAGEALGAEEPIATDLITEGRRNTHLTGVAGHCSGLAPHAKPLRLP